MEVKKPLNIRLKCSDLRIQICLIICKGKQVSNPYLTSTLLKYINQGENTIIEQQQKIRLCYTVIGNNQINIFILTYSSPHAIHGRYVPIPPVDA